MSRKVTGLYLHPVLAIYCRDDFVIGLAGFHTFSYEAKRKKRSNIKENRRPIEEKKSHRWLSCAEESKTTLSKAKMITIISDRESDIYEYLARIPDAKTHLIVRSRLQRPPSLRNSTLSRFNPTCGTSLSITKRPLEHQCTKTGDSIFFQSTSINDDSYRHASVWKLSRVT